MDSVPEGGMPAKAPLKEWKPVAATNTITGLVSCAWTVTVQVPC